MKTFQIEDAKTRFFNSKEDYLKFKQAWKDFHNDGHVVELKEYKDADGTHEYKVNTLNASHYMIYNLLRGYDITRGFVPLVNKGRLNANGGNPWKNCDEAANTIIRVAQQLKNINAESEWSRKWAREAKNKLLLPFDGTISNQMLYDLAAEIYTHLTQQVFPSFTVEEDREIEKPVKRKTVVQRVRACGGE